jgi:hypothetical protein
MFSVCVCVCVFLCLCTGRGLATSCCMQRCDIHSENNKYMMNIVKPRVMVISNILLDCNN